MSVKQNLFVAVFVHECLMMFNDVEYTTFKVFVTQMSDYLFVISFQLMFYKTLRYRLTRAFVYKCLMIRLWLNDNAILKLQLHDAIYRLRFYSNSLIHILSFSNLHNNLPSIQKNRGDKSHRVIVA